MYFVDNLNHKNKLLEHLLIQPGVKQTIIFTKLITSDGIVLQSTPFRENPTIYNSISSTSSIARKWNSMPPLESCFKLMRLLSTILLIILNSILQPTSRKCLSLSP